MTRRSRQYFFLVLLLLTLPLLTAAAVYRFTFSNPSVGSLRAEFVLEYFSAADCAPCKAFEIEALPGLQSSIRSGQVRVVFRGLPVDEQWRDYSLRLFCLQEHDQYLDRRRAAKSSPSFDWGTLPTLTGRQKARHDQCLQYSAVDEVQQHNKLDFDRRGFHGTPAFTLSYVDTSGVNQSHFSGFATVQRLQSRMQSLQPITPPLASR